MAYKIRSDWALRRNRSGSRDQGLDVVHDFFGAEVVGAVEAVGEDFSVGVDEDEVGDAVAAIAIGFEVIDIVKADGGPGHGVAFHVGEHVVFGLVMINENQFEVGVLRFKLIVKVDELGSEGPAGSAPRGRVVEGPILDVLQRGGIEALEASIFQNDQMMRVGGGETGELVGIGGIQVRQGIGGGGIGRGALGCQGAEAESKGECKGEAAFLEERVHTSRLTLPTGHKQQRLGGPKVDRVPTHILAKNVIVGKTPSVSVP